MTTEETRVDVARELLRRIREVAPEGESLFLSSSGGVSAGAFSIIMEIILDQLEEIKKTQAPLDMSWTDWREVKEAKRRKIEGED